jgi:tetratricopeptide (TPR) repeat protein
MMKTMTHTLTLFRLGAVRASTVAILGLAAITIAAVAWILIPRPGTPDAPQGPVAMPAAASAKVLTPERLEEIVTAALGKAQNSEFGHAETLIENALREFPKSQELHLALAQLKAGRDPEGSYKAYAAAVAVGPATGPIQYGAGGAALGAGLLERAGEHFAAAIGAEPRVAEYHVGLAEVFNRQGKIEDALAELTKASNLAPEKAEPWAVMADLSLKQNRPGVAIQYIKRARELEPARSAWRLVEARALNRMGKPQEAINLLGALDEAERVQIPVVRLAAESFGLLNRPADAATWWIRASDAAPTRADTAYDAALAARKAGNLSEAKRLAERASVLGHADAKTLTRELAAAPDR